MIWPLRAVIGPALWAVAFVVIYALHGIGCAWHWPAQAGLGINLHQTILIGAWGLFLLATLAVALRRPPAAPTPALIVRAGGWIGFGGVALTLFHVLGLTTCG